MKQKILSLAFLLMVLSGCSTKPPMLPAQIDKPAVVLTKPCKTPENMDSGASSQALTAWALQWIDAYRCADNKRRALVQSWPK